MTAETTKAQTERHEREDTQACLKSQLRRWRYLQKKMQKKTDEYQFLVDDIQREIQKIREQM